ncbi:MAG: hypothetical protein ACI9FW_002081, partial [Flavobacterium sp.]
PHCIAQHLKVLKINRVSFPFIFKLFCEIVLFNPYWKKQIKDTVQSVSNVSDNIG